MPTRRAGRRSTQRLSTGGFTLVELMVVISIIGLLVTLLVPVVSSARLIAAKAATTKTIKDLSMGLENYKGDFGEYPPSRPSWKTGNIPKGQMHRGAANLVWYLCGPAGNGWGVDAAGQMPSYPNVTMRMSRPTRSYGPYFKATSDAVAYEPDPFSGQTVMGAILDGFKPAGSILYFRYEANPELDSAGAPKQNYQVSDNNSTSTAEATGDPKGKTNYHSQIYFLEAGPNFNTNGAVRFYLWAGSAGNVYRYVRTDFLLVSPGADGVYGLVEKGTDGLFVPVTRDNAVKKTGKNYDDITNFN
jgi:prepilin-type N-terminal cleavage/methylation domain-containing protein